MTGLAEQFHYAAHVVFLDEDVIGVVSADGEDGDAVAGKRLDEREQDSGLRKQEWTFELEARPARAGGDIFRNIAGGADDGKFVGGAGDRSELAARGPGGDGCVRGEAEDGVGAAELAELEGLRHRLECKLPFHVETEPLAFRGRSFVCAGVRRGILLLPFWIASDPRLIGSRG